MNGINTKINAMLKRLLQQKGQSLTEFALILGFCVAIGWAANEVGFLDAIGAVFESGTKPPQEVAAIGGGTGTSGGTTPTEPPTPPIPPVAPGVGRSGFDWGVIDPNTYFEQSYEDKNKSLDGGKTWVNFETAEASQEDRLSADQKALENIARFFVGKTKGEVAAVLKEKYFDKADMGAGKPSDSIELNLGHFRLSNSLENGTGMRFEVTGNDGLKESEAENIFKWMVDPYNPDSIEYKNNYNYLVSDYAVSQGWVGTIKEGTDQKNGLKLRLEYDYSGNYENDSDVVVIGAHVAIDPKSQFNNQLGLVDKYNRKTSQGLDVQVRRDADGLIHVDTNNTGVPIIDGKSAVGGNAGLYNWYGETDYRLVQAYINSKAEAITLGATSITHDFKRGELVKKGSDWYIALNDASFTLDINSNFSKGDLSKNFVMIQRTDAWKYWHENNKTDDGPKIMTLKVRGTVFTKDNGDVFVYVGIQPPQKGTPVNIVTDINESNPDWVKIGNMKQG